MPTANEILFDESIAHQIDLQGYSNGVVRKMLALLNRVDADLMQQITVALEKLPPSQFNIERLEALLTSVRALNSKAYADVSTELQTEIKDLIEYEAGYQQQLLTSVLPSQVAVNAVNVNQVYAAAMARPFQISKGGAAPLNEYLIGLSEARAKLIRDAIRMGFIESETLEATIRRIKGTKSLNYADGLLDAPRRHIEGMVRTAINHTAAFTHNAVFTANEDIIKGWRFVATLDGRTSITCASLSNRVYPVGKGPMPPRHINCRSTMSPIIKSWKEIGLNIDEISGLTRSSMDGQVPRDISFTDWLRKKPASVQDEVLGATRGKLFRDNKMEVTGFANNKGIVYTLDELRKRNSKLFEKAGL